MLKILDKNDFDKLFRLMEISFPTDEYRTYEEQKALLEDPQYRVWARYTQQGDIQGFLAVWVLDTFSFVEHFAVDPNYRNSGIGAAMLSELVEMCPNRICLEVELPEGELACRRIGFYQRNRFVLNDYTYMQPAISQGKNPIPLRIMTYPEGVSEEVFADIRRVLYRKVYGQKDFE